MSEWFLFAIVTFVEVDQLPRTSGTNNFVCRLQTLEIAIFPETKQFEGLGWLWNFYQFDIFLPLVMRVLWCSQLKLSNHGFGLTQMGHSALGILSATQSIRMDKKFL